MNGIRPILDLARLFYYRWALADMTRANPFHPDLPYVVHRLNQLERSA